jgi:hypothetical protein
VHAGGVLSNHRERSFMSVGGIETYGYLWSSGSGTVRNVRALNNRTHILCVVCVMAIAQN